MWGKTWQESGVPRVFFFRYYFLYHQYLLWGGIVLVVMDAADSGAAIDHRKDTSLPIDCHRLSHWMRDSLSSWLEIVATSIDVVFFSLFQGPLCHVAYNALIKDWTRWWFVLSLPRLSDHTESMTISNVLYQPDWASRYDYNIYESLCRLLTRWNVGWLEMCPVGRWQAEQSWLVCADRWTHRQSKRLWGQIGGRHLWKKQ